ncbi:hypothetical protein F6X56_02555 (plasmid) [Rhodococcus erythropolis]|jgi:hypothetical protein|uniref:ApeA N-terminal domain 1-containing protein n=3 Tax=Actinomycetota TaxID=201174 RepID=UPI0001A21495|nr:MULTISPECIES: hypothetical protein [Rhodococcus]EEN83830.1 hypothetical protein RHOER0001_0211 [Rhodococcus erythropolis SK121]NHP18612.1 hypothetical protein [Rhodococcus sp. IC4_135]KDQ00462.1 hypothetical protein EN35_32040 [Rhodococcus qingshengii]KSU59367.1 hypothetical protein AS032_34515 [Rhodococcus qingshengii]MCQ4152593.1 hypothetical protein [Rhodococcus qingshengii]
MATTEQLHGQWWVPDSNGPSRTVPGVLTLSDSTEPRLDLHGDLYDIHELGFRTVHGNSGGRAVSLFETYIDSEKGGFTNGQKYTDQTIKLSGLVIGDSHVNDADELAFTESVIELDYLTYWARGVKIAVSHPEKSNEPYIFTIPVSAPLSGKYGNVEVTVSTSSHYASGGQFSRGGMSIPAHFRTAFRVTSAEPLSINAHIEISRRLADLITLAMHRPAHVRRIKFSRNPTSASAVRLVELGPDQRGHRPR